MTLLGEAPGIGPVAKRVYARWQLLKFNLFWNVLRNPPSRRRLARQRPELTPSQRAVVDNLQRSGIAFTSFETLFADAQRWGRLVERVRAFASSSRVQEGLAIYRRELQRAQEAGGRLSREQARILKGYFIRLYSEDETPTVSVTDELLQFAVNPRLLDVVNSYFGMWGKLIYFDLWHTVPVGTQDTRFGSQEWHRDPEDRTKCRIYLYFSPVDSDAGPLEYVPGSHRGGRYSTLFPWTSPVGKNYPPQEELERRVPPLDRVACTGPSGTLVFCDTIGFHRGGISRTAPRILATWGFVTPASLHGHRFKVDWGSGGEALSAAARFAIG